MKLIVVLINVLWLTSAQLNSYHEFKENSGGKNVTDYALEIGLKNFAHEFNKFKIENNKQYMSQEEEEERKFNFLKTLKFIQKHNQLFKSGDVTHEVGISLFADMTSEEYAQSFSMPSPLNLNVTPVGHYEEEASVYASLPDSFDWRRNGKVSPVKYQGKCGSCWAFTAVSLVESGYLIHYNQRVVLSEQQLVDCLDSKCGGVYINKALSYIHDHGVEQSYEYPYQDKALSCRNTVSKYHAHISGYHSMGRAAGQNPASDGQIMTALINNGPIGFMLDASGDDFAHYRGGVLTTGINQWKAVHAMTIVGWGTQNNVPYWLIKNSWGTQWGEAGFLKLARNKDMRGINEWLYYPTF